MKKSLPFIVAGFVAGLFHILPFFKTFACCLAVPFAAYFSLILDQRANNNYERIVPQKALIFGIMTGVFAALFGSFFEIFITLITKSNDFVENYYALEQLVHSFPFPIDDAAQKEALAMLRSVRDSISETGFSLLYTSMILVSNLTADIIAGTIGGLIGMQVINKRNRDNNG